MVIETHTRAIFREFALRLRNNPVFSLPGAVAVVEEGTSPVSTTQYISSYLECADNSQALHVHLCADEIVVVTIEPRTGKISLRDTGDLGAAGRGPRFLAISEKLNENPTALQEALTRLRINVRNVIRSIFIHNYVSLDDCRTGGAKGKLSGLADISTAQFLARRYASHTYLAFLCC
jgi:hypothetical protein